MYAFSSVLLLVLDDHPWPNADCRVIRTGGCSRLGAPCFDNYNI